MPAKSKGRAKGHRNLSDEQVREAFLAWMRLGSSLKASEATGFHDSTIRSHKNRHPDAWDRVLAEYEHERAEAIRRAAHDAASALPDAIAALAKIAIESESDRDRVNAARVLGQLAEAAGRERRLDDGLATEVHDHRSDADLLREVRADLAKLGLPDSALSVFEVQ